MYRGFNLEEVITDKMVTQFQSKGQSLYDNNKNLVLDKFKAFVKSNNRLNGSEIEALFFPQIKADVFISHSHKNEDKVIALAGMLHEKFGITSFIDSCLWKSARDLQKILDGEHSWIDPNDKKTYAYEQVGFSASHVHMMLSVALSKMIDKTECIIFYNTPQAIVPYMKGSNTTSPWIYSEITTTQIINKKIPPRRTSEYTRLYSKGGYVNESLQLIYQLDLSHLTQINATSFNEWIAKTARTPEEGLDFLYNRFPLKREKTFL
jgi:hypothetical protein